MHFLVLLTALVACAAGDPVKTAKPTQDGRIVGGNPARIEDHPHQVAILFFGSYACGGSIISPTCVVTTAYCIWWTNANFLTVRAGSAYHDFGGTIHSVTGGFYHGNYSYYGNMEYDVAVLRVDPPFTYSDSVHNIELQDSEMHPGTTVAVTGWGDAWTGGSFSFYLNEALVQIRDDTMCYDWGFDADNMICAGSYSGYIGPCYGDEGGPLTTLYCPRKLVGLVSWRHWYCGDPFYPAIYTKISAVRNWIIDLCSAQIIPKGITKAPAIP